MKTQSEKLLTWKWVGLVILSVRFVQGWIFWAGGSRRFIYSPQKLDPHSATWLANKLQSAMPGALLGAQHIISYLLQHFVLLYVALILFSLAELICGLCLMLGFLTRLAAFGTVLISVALMVIFGWEGSTCLDEWTMAVSNFAMGMVLLSSGAAIYSIDSWLMRRNHKLEKKTWFAWVGSAPLAWINLQRLAIISLIITILFTLSTYNYYRGAILSHYHAGPVSPVAHHLTLTDGKINADTVSFIAYVDAGTPAAPSYIVSIELLNDKNAVIQTWLGKELSFLPKENINNMYPYNRISTGPYGLVAPVSARALIKLKLKEKLPDNKKYELKLFTVGGDSWKLLIE